MNWNLLDELESGWARGKTKEVEGTRSEVKGIDKNDGDKFGFRTILSGVRNSTRYLATAFYHPIFRFSLSVFRYSSSRSLQTLIVLLLGEYCTVSWLVEYVQPCCHFVGLYV